MVFGSNPFGTRKKLFETATSQNKRHHELRSLDVVSVISLLSGLNFSNTRFGGYLPNFFSSFRTSFKDAQLSGTLDRSFEEVQQDLLLSCLTIG
jgi:hypothetical protein